MLKLRRVVHGGALGTLELVVLNPDFIYHVRHSCFVSMQLGRDPNGFRLTTHGFDHLNAAQGNVITLHSRRWREVQTCCRGAGES
jgi:hypothetical protein